MEIFDTLTISDFFLTRQQHPVPAVCVCKRKRAKFLFCPYILPQSHTTTVKLAMYPPSVGVKMNEGNNLLVRKLRQCIYILYSGVCMRGKGGVAYCHVTNGLSYPQENYCAGCLLS